VTSREERWQNDVLSSYEPSVYNDLNASTDRVLLFEAMHELPQLGEVILRYGMQDDVGINFLHKHFPLSENERLVETIQSDCTITHPVGAEDAAETVPYLWKVVESEGLISWKPLEFVTRALTTDDASDQLARLAGSEGFLAELARRLVELELTDVFGICTLHRSALLTDDEHVLLERTDAVARHLTLIPILHSELNSERDMETVWAFHHDAQGRAASNCRNACVHVNNHH
jgi:hypothetical protein